MIGLSVLSPLAAVVGVTYAQLHYRETELEWQTTTANGKLFKLLLPVGWRTEKWIGGSGYETVYFRPSSTSDWLPGWLSARFESEQDSEEGLFLCVGSFDSKSDGNIRLYNKRENGQSYLSAVRQLPSGWFSEVSYTRRDKRIFDATHKRICDSLQLAPAGH